MADASFNTLAPTFQLLLDGTAAPVDLAVNVIGIRVTDDLTRPSRFTLNVSDVGRVWTKSNKFKSGREVEVKLGYLAKLESVIKAEVHSWEVEVAAEGPARLVIHGYDRLHRFTRSPKTRTFINQKDSEIIKAIAQEHGLSVEADDSVALRPFVLQNNVSDFDFILERAALCGFEIQVRAKKLYFKKPAVTRQPVAKLTWGENIGRIAHEINTFDQAPKVEVRAWDPVNRKLLTAPAKVGDEISKMGGQTVGAKLTKERFGDVEQFVLSAATSLKELESAAKAEYNRRAGNFVQIECRVDGDPNIRAGTIVEIEKAGKRLDGVYYVTWAEHTFYTDAGYATEFKARRYTMEKGSGPPKDVTPKGIVSAIDGVTSVVNAVTKGVEKARACFQAAKSAVEKANKTLQDAQRALNNTIAAVKTAVEAVESALENAKAIADAAFKQAGSFVDGAKKALDDAKGFLLKAADTVGAPPEFKNALESAFKAADNAVGAAKNGLSMAEDFLGKGGKVFEKADELWGKIKGKLGSKAAGDVIALGERIAPPKIAVIASSESDEKQWFARLTKVATDALQPGDILLEKVYGGSHPVVSAQNSFVADKGSRFTAQALLCLGNGEVARLTAEGVKFESLEALGKSGVLGRVVAYRAKKASEAAGAVSVARWLSEQGVVYSSAHCFETPTRNYSWNANARKRAAQIAERTLPAKELMCSEFVAYCYQGTPTPLVTVDARRIAPLELEDWLNDGDVFTFAGALGEAELTGEETDIDDLKTQSNGLQEAGTEAKKALETALSAVALCKTAVGKASANDAAGADAVTEQAEQKCEEAQVQAQSASDAAADVTSDAHDANSPQATPEASGEGEGAPAAQASSDAQVTESDGTEQAAPAAEGDEGAQAAESDDASEDAQVAADESAEPQAEDGGEGSQAAADSEDESARDAASEEQDSDGAAAQASEPAAGDDSDESDPQEAVEPAQSGDEQAPAADAASSTEADAQNASDDANAVGEEESGEGAPQKADAPELEANSSAASELDEEAAALPGSMPDAGAADLLEDAGAQKDVSDESSLAEALAKTTDGESDDSRGVALDQSAGLKTPVVDGQGVGSSQTPEVLPGGQSSSSGASPRAASAQGDDAAVQAAVAGTVAAAGIGASIASKLAGAKSDTPTEKAASAAGNIGQVGNKAKQAADVSVNEESLKGAANKASKATSAGSVADQAGTLAADARRAEQAQSSALDDAKAVRTAAEAGSSDEVARKAGRKMPKVGMQDVSDARSSVAKAKGDAARLQWQAENAGEIAKGAATGGVTSDVRALQTEASHARYMAENADAIAKGAVENEVIGDVRRVQTDAARVQYMAENAGSVSKGAVTEGLKDELGVREMKSEAARAQYFVENADEVAKGRVENAVTSEVRAAQVELRDEVRSVTKIADEPGRMASDAQSLKLDVASRADRIASGDLTEANRTAGDVQVLKENLGIDDLELELPDVPDDSGKPS